MWFSAFSFISSAEMELREIRITPVGAYSGLGAYLSKSLLRVGLIREKGLNGSFTVSQIEGRLFKIFSSKRSVSQKSCYKIIKVPYR